MTYHREQELIAMEEAAPSGVHSREDDRQKTCPSPAYTREELVEIATAATSPEYHHTHKPDSDGYWKARHKIQKRRKLAAKTVDALIACGALKVGEASNG